MQGSHLHDELFGDRSDSDMNLRVMKQGLSKRQMNLQCSGIFTGQHLRRWPDDKPMCQKAFRWQLNVYSSVQWDSQLRFPLYLSIPSKSHLSVLGEDPPVQIQGLVERREDSCVELVPSVALWNGKK